jgi:hypothetical protein
MAVEVKDNRNVSSPAIQRRDPKDPAPGTMLKKIAYTCICLVTLLSLFIWGLKFGYKRGYADGSKATNNWWIEKKVKQFETSEVIKKRLNKQHQAI